MRSEGSVKLTYMTDETYRSYLREYENDPDLFRPGHPYVKYEYSEEKAGSSSPERTGTSGTTASTERDRTKIPGYSSVCYCAGATAVV